MRKESKVKAVIFDVGGVLSVPTHPVIKNREKVSGVHDYIAEKLKIDSDSWFDSIDSVYADSIIGKVSKREFLKVVSKKLGISEKKLFLIVKDSYYKKMKKNSKLFELAAKLRKNGYIAGILSDQWALSTELIIPYKDRKEFDFSIISTEVGVRKPDLKIYKLLMKRLKKIDKRIKVSNVLFIDNREWNLIPARKLGIKTILFESNEQTMREMRNLKINF